MTLRCNEAYLRWRSTPLSTMYQSMTSESSAGDSSFDSSARPSHKRCRSSAATMTSYIHAVTALFPSHANLLPLCKRFRDSISPEDSVEEDIDADELADIEVEAMTVEDSVRTPAERVILFGTIPTTIPNTTLSVTSPTTHIDTTLIPTISPSPDYTPASPDYSPASDTKFNPFEDPSSDHIPPLPATSPFLSSIDDSSNSDIHDTPPSPTHGTPFIETTLSTQRSPTAPGALRRRVMVLAPGQPIPHGRPYRYYLNRLVHMMTARKRVGPMPTHRLAVRHSVDYSSSDDSSSSSSLSSSSETSSGSSTNVLSDSASSRSSFDHSLPASPSDTRSSHHLCSLIPGASVPLSSPILGALSYACADLLPSPKRIRSPKTSTFIERLKDSYEPYVPREVGLGVNFEDESTEPSRSRGTDLEIDVDVERSDGIEIDPEIQAEIDECFAYADALRDRGIDARVVVEAIDQEEIEMGIRGPVKVRVDRVTHPVVADDFPEPAQEGAVEVTYETLGDLVQRTMPNTRSRASRTRDGVNEQSDRRMAETVRVRDDVRNLGPLIGNEGEQEEVNGNGGNRDKGNGNGGNGNEENGNGNENRGEYGYNLRGFMPARECTYQDFLKKTIRIEAAYAMSWAELMKLMTEVYCPRNEVQKIETELWNLAVKGNDLTAYTRRF
ncbi:hypothetical protein Tco_0970119 [Tanacetum coccineum]